MIVDSDDVSQWFGEYLDAFAACGRGERDTASLLAYTARRCCAPPMAGT